MKPRMNGPPKGLWLVEENGRALLDTVKQEQKRGGSRSYFPLMTMELS